LGEGVLWFENSPERPTPPPNLSLKGEESNGRKLYA